MDKKKVSYQEGKVSTIVNTGQISQHHYHLHNYVSQKELSFHIKLNGSKSIRESHRIATAIERNIYDEMCISTTIHVDPDILETCGGDSSH